MLIKLNRTWTLTEPLGSGGFGQVFKAVSAEGTHAAVKLVPKANGFRRELLFVDLAGARNVVPVLDSGETDSDWVIVMPLADESLRQRLERASGPLPVGEVVSVLSDAAAALTDLEGRVVHRDVKPDNLLLLDGRWCLADFGISRYAEAATAPDTQKYALSAPYGAPERWRGDRAMISTDVYSLGVIAFEMLAGRQPFPGPASHDYRAQHLHQDAAGLTAGPAPLKALIMECLYKAPESRPQPSELLARLERLARGAASAGLARLEEANLANVGRMGDAARLASNQRSAAERRQDLHRSAAGGFDSISDELRSTLASAAPSARVEIGRSGGWTMYLGPAVLQLRAPEMVRDDPWPPSRNPAFDVAAHASVVLTIPTDRYGYSGRGHSLWFCDAREPGRYGWFETAFMHSAFSRFRSAVNPFPCAPGLEAAEALFIGIGAYALARPFERLVPGELDHFIARWADLLAQAGNGHLGQPQTMPEGRPAGSWRTS